MIGENINTATLPQNNEAERALLGSIILQNNLLDLVYEAVPAVAIHDAIVRIERMGNHACDEPLFANAAHEVIFGVMCKLAEGGRSFDLTVLGIELGAIGRLDVVGGAPYLAALEDDIFALGQVPEYIRIIVDHWRRRSLVRACQQTTMDALTGAGQVDELMNRAEKRIFDLTVGSDKKGLVAVRDRVGELVAELRERSRNKVGSDGMKTGFAKLDETTGGLQRANLVILAARPSKGKTALALNIASHVALRERRPVGFFSLEMSQDEIITRLLSTEAKVPIYLLREARIIPADTERLEEARRRLETAELHIDDTSGLSVLELRSRARRLASRFPELGLIVIDYLQLMHAASGRRDFNRQQEVSEISGALKGLAKELNVPVLALSQLSRQVEQRRGSKTDDKLPKLSDLRDSGSIEQDADIVLFIHREDPKRKEGVQHDILTDATLRIAKHRNGSIGDIDLFFNGRYTEFCNKA